MLRGYVYEARLASKWLPTMPRVVERLRAGAALFGQAALDVLEAARELGVGAPERVLRIDL